MIIENSILSDIDFILGLFKQAIEYQKAKGYNLWIEFDRTLIETKIRENRHFKIIDNNAIVCIFSVLYTDPVIWGDKDNGDAVYLHRITTNPAYKGKGLIQVVKSWAIEYARQKNKKFLRMDTWGNNETLRNYYINQGFNYIGQQHLIPVEGVPPHYGGMVLSLFENEV